MKRIFLLGAYGQNNIGDDALLEVFLKQFANAHIVVNSARPAATSQRYGVETVATYLGWPRLRRPRAILQSDMIVFGGGSLLKEIEGGALAQIAYLLRILALLLLARLLGRPSAMLGVGIGPLSSPTCRRLSRLVANMTDLICVRDNASRDLLLEIGVRRPVHVAADPVFTFDAPAAAPAPATRPLVVVIPRYSLGHAQQQALADACDQLVEQHGAQIVLLPFQTGYAAKYDDLRSAEAIAGRMRHATSASVHTPATTDETLALIGQAQLVISSRLHGLIFAAIQGVAGVAINYEVKVGSFMAEIGQAWACLTPAELAEGRLPALAERAWAARAANGAAVRKQIGVLRMRAQRNFMLAHELLAQPRPKGMLGGGALLLASMTIVNAGNYLFNLVLGRWLGPTAFADLSLIVTLLLLVTLITATLQTISAKFAAVYSADGDQPQVARLQRWLGRRAWLAGLALGGALALGGPLWQQFFHTASYWPFVLLAVGLPFYFAQGVDRGVLQGQLRFGPLALTYQAEMWVRLAAAIAFVALGWWVSGAVAGVALSLVATWLVSRWALRPLLASPAARAAELPAGEQRAVATFALPVIGALIGQVLINNSDILIVKHFFAPEAAGHYAALALIGRIVFFATASVVAAMFPAVAQRQRRGEPHAQLLWYSLGLVLAASAVIIAATLLAPGPLVGMLFGAAYLPIAPLLWLYALATMLYALANVVVNYNLSASGRGGSWLTVLFGAAQVGGLWLFHGSLREVVLVQVYLMGGLFLALLAWNWRQARVSQAKTVPDRDDRRPTTDGTRVAARQKSVVKGVPSRLARRWRSLLLGSLALALLLMMWQAASAQGLVLGPHPAQEQIRQILPALRDSEAERASGAYIPGVGAVIALDLIRGPNSLPDKASYAGVHDWAYYLLGAFGPKLSAVPADETIAISIEYFEYRDRVYHQFVISSRAGDIADGAKYHAWLEGQPYEQAVAQIAGQPAPAVPAAQAPAAPAASASYTFDDAGAGAAEWAPLAGSWQTAEGGYAQSELGRYDLASLLQRPIAGGYRLQADVKFVEGEMGGGLIFNAPNGDNKSGALMISYSEKGSYLQWGGFDDKGVFAFKGGSPVPSGADGKWHTLAVRVSAGSYGVSLDGTQLVAEVPLNGQPGGHVGLFASTSHVIFDNIVLELDQP